MAAFYVYEHLYDENHPCFTRDPLAMALESRMIPEEYFSQQSRRMKSQNMLAKMVKEAKKQAQLEQFEQNYFEAINDFLEDITDDDSESEENNSENNMEDEECNLENNAKNNDDIEKETEITVVQPETKLESEEEKTNKNNSIMTSKVMVKEDLEKMEIKIELFGAKFKPEHLDINVVNGCVATLVVKAEDGDDQKFERQFKLPSETNIDKIDSKFFYKKDKDKQTLQITIPKDVKIVQLPISMEEDQQ